MCTTSTSVVSTDHVEVRCHVVPAIHVSGSADHHYSVVCLGLEDTSRADLICSTAVTEVTSAGSGSRLGNLYAVSGSRLSVIVESSLTSDSVSAEGRHGHAHVGHCLDNHSTVCGVRHQNY